MRNYISIVAIAIAIFASCKGETKPESQSEENNKYPSIIDSLGLSKIYDETKWRMYCYQCDDTLTFLDKDDPEKVFFGTLDLKFDTVRVDKDQTELNFNFVYKGINCDNKLVKNTTIRGVVYRKNTDSLLYYSMNTDALPYLSDSCPDIKNCRSRFINPLQPEVVKFISDKKNQINPWFYNMAKEKGLVK